jgi:hypothetical protein
MKKAAGKGLMDDLRPEYNLSQLKGGMRGKYYREAVAGTNLVLIEPDLADIFPDSESTTLCGFWSLQLKRPRVERAATATPIKR